MALNLGNLYFQLGARTDGLNKAERHARKFSNNTERHFNRTSKAARRLGLAIAGIVTIEAGRRAILLADSYNVLQVRLKTATKATGDYARVSREVFEISQRNGTALETNVELFQSLARVAPDLGATTSEMLELTEVVGQLGVIGGASSEAIRNGLLQFTQGLASGILRAEEMNSILENLPEIASRMAIGMNVTVGELRKMVINGEVLSQDVFDSLLKQSGEIAEEFAGIPPTVDRAFSSLMNSTAQFLGQIDAATGITQSLANLFIDISEFMETDLTSNFKDAEESIIRAKENLELWTPILDDIYEAMEPIGGWLVEQAAAGFAQAAFYLNKALKFLVELPASDEQLKAIEARREARKIEREEEEILAAYSKERAIEEQALLEEQQKVAAAARKKEIADKKAAEEEKAAFEKSVKQATPRIESLADSLATELELQQKYYEDATALLDEAESLKIETIIPYQELRERLEEEHQMRLGEITAKHTAGRDKVEAMSAFLGVDLTKKAEDLTLKEQAKSFRSQIDGAAQHSREFFAVKKALSIATALIEAPKAVLSAYTFGTQIGGPPVGAIFAGLAAAATAVQVQAIASQGFSGGKERGGDVFGGSLYRVNENGPELLTVGQSDYLMMGSQGGKITPNNQFASGGGVINISQTINIDVEGEDAGLEDRIRLAAEEGGRMGYDMVVDDLARNGQIRKAI